MRYVIKLLCASVLLFSSRVLAADTSTQFELKNKSKNDISIVYKVEGAKAITKQVKGFDKWATTFDHSALPTLQITTDTGDTLNFEFSVSSEQSIKLEYDKNWKTKQPELKPKFDILNIKADGIKQVESAKKEEEQPSEAAQEEAPAKEEKPAKSEEPVATENPTEPTPEASEEPPAKAKPAEKPSPVEKPVQSANQEPASTLKVKPEELFDVTSSMSDLEKAQKILVVKYLSDLRVATGETPPTNAADLTRAQSEVTKAYKAQAKLWDGSEKLSYKIVSIMKRHDVTDVKDQKALAAQALQLIKSTYTDIETKFAK